MKLKSKIFSLVITVASVLSIVACNEDNVNPVEKPDSEVTGKFQTYVYKGVRYKEPVNNSDRYVNEILNKVWFNNPTASIKVEDNIYYIYDSFEEIKREIAQRRSSNARVDRPSATIELFKDDRYNILLSSYVGPSEGEQFSFKGLKGVNDEVSSVWAANNSRAGTMYVNLMDNSNNSGRGMVLTLKAGEGTGLPRLKNNGMNDIISYWDFGYLN